MKTKLLLLFFAFSAFASGQVNFSGIDKQCFLIGTLDDYMGRRQTFSAAADSFYFQKVDVYWENQKNIASLIDSLFKDEHHDLHLTDNGASRGIRLYSKSLSAKINSYYNFSSSGTYTKSHDTIYTGSLKPGFISIKSEILSFLAGAYLRDGGKTNSNEYFFSIPNSAGKAKICKELLNEVNCLDVKHVILNNIPKGNIILFKPSEEMMKMIIRIDPIKNDKPFPSEIIEIVKGLGT